MSKRIVNLTDHAHSVPVTNEAGEQREIFVQPNGRPKLPDGFTPTAAFLFRNPGFKVLDDTPAPIVTPTPVPVVPSSVTNSSTETPE